LMSKDFSGGYGPLEYSIRNSREGNFEIRVSYFSPKQVVLMGGEITVSVKIFTNWCRPNERQYVKTIRLSKPKDRISVAKIQF